MLIKNKIPARSLKLNNRLKNISSILVAAALIWIFPDLGSFLSIFIYGELRSGLQVPKGGTDASMSAAFIIYVFILMVYFAFALKAYYSNKVVLRPWVRWVLSLILPLAFYSWLGYQLFAPTHLIAGAYTLAGRGDLGRVDLLLTYAVNVNDVFTYEDVNQEAYSMLQYAILKDQPKMVEMLLKQGADPNYRNRRGSTAKDLAKEKNMDEILAILSKQK